MQQTRPPAPAAPPRAQQPTAYTAAPIGFVKRSDGQAVKRRLHAFEAFALEHVLDRRERVARRARQGDAPLLTLRAAWQAATLEAEIQIKIMPQLSKLKCRPKARQAMMRGRCRAFFKGKNQPCPCCGERVNYIGHWRLRFSAAERFKTEAHNKLVLRLVQAIQQGLNPPTYIFINAGSKERPSEWTVPQEFLPHLGPPGQRGFDDVPDIMCCYVRSTPSGELAWAGPGHPVKHPSFITLLPIEVAACWDFTFSGQGAATPAGTLPPQAHGGLVATRIRKEDTYARLLCLLAAQGFTLAGVTALPAPPGQEAGEYPANPTSFSTCY